MSCNSQNGKGPINQQGSADVVVSVEKLSKSFLIYDRPQDRLKQAIVPRIQQLLHKKTNRYFNEFKALDNVSLTVAKGETVGVIGRNGSGKSTLLQIICGTLHPTVGEVRTRGRVAALLELGSGFNPEFTGRENVYLNAAVLGLTEEEIDDRFNEIAAFADIGTFIEQPTKSYSSGMTVRLAFAVQAMIEPDILIVDEALAVGDEKFQRKCFTRLNELKDRGTSIIFVSHSGPQIVELCDRAILLEKGIKLTDGEPARVVRAYQKLIYAPMEDQRRLMKEYLAQPEGIKNISEEEKQLDMVSRKDEQGDYDPSLHPETTTVYPVQGAEIKNVQILDAGGRKVNMLELGQNYEFVVSGKILSDTERVYFGLHIRSTSGIEIMGQRYPGEGKFIELTEGQRDFMISFFFKMILLPGVYFVGTGIWSSGDPNCCHRIMDALMFRVNPDKKNESFGYIDGSCKPPEVQLY